MTTPKTTLTGHAEDYLRLRRALGFKLERAGQLLPQLVTHLEAAGATTVTSDLAIAWAARLPENAQPNHWAQRLVIARGFTRYLQTIDPTTQVPPAGVFPTRRHRPTPYLWSAGDIDRLLEAAEALRPPLRAATHHTLFGLLAVSGMRLGEAIGLDRDDVVASADLVYDFLEVEWRTIHHYGVEIDGRRYDGPGVNDYRSQRSAYGGAHPGKWPFMVDRDDVRWVFFRDPATSTWHRLEWEHAPGIDAPFSADAARYVRAVGVNTHRHVDPQQAVADLLAGWAAGEVTSRRDRNLAIRLASQRAAGDPTADGEDAGGTKTADERARASAPGVVDLLQRREQRRGELASDDDDVFAAYYPAHPDSDGLEVFDE